MNQIKYNNVRFGKSEKIEQQPNTEEYAEKVPANYDTARAYAGYGIKNKVKDTTPLNDLSLNINGVKGYDAVLVSILSDYKEPSEAKEGLSDIRQAVLDGYVKALSSVGITSVAISSKDVGTLIGTKGSPESINSVILMAKFLNSNAIINKNLFENIKNDLKSYYKVNWDSIKTAKDDENLKYKDFKNAGSINEVYEKLDNISYDDYLKYCEEITENQNNYIDVDVPKKMLDNKQIDAKEVERQVLNKISVNGDYKMEIN